MWSKAKPFHFPKHCSKLSSKTKTSLNKSFSIFCNADKGCCRDCLQSTNEAPPPHPNDHYEQRRRASPALQWRKSFGATLPPSHPTGAANTTRSCWVAARYKSGRMQCRRSSLKADLGPASITPFWDIASSQSSTKRSPPSRPLRTPI